MRSQQTRTKTEKTQCKQFGQLCPLFWVKVPPAYEALNLLFPQDMSASWSTSSVMSRILILIDIL